eukprot:1069713-Pleurochrysis_carterae.AAC.8
MARMRSSSLPLPLQACAYDRRAAAHEMRLASSAVSGGRPEDETGPLAAAGAAVFAAAGAADDCVCERVWRAVDCRLGGSEVPCVAKTGLRGDGESNVWGKSSRERQWSECSRLNAATLPCDVRTYPYSISGE